jgi:holo-[acyl-carrier protein] synthase
VPGLRRRSTPVGVGIDLITISDVNEALKRFGDRYVRRTYTTAEAAYCHAASGVAAAARFAARFAAKEAAVKALQPGHRWTDWRAIEVRRHASGRCGLVLHREAAELAALRGVRRLELSMSHDHNHAVAIVVAVGGV